MKDRLLRKLVPAVPAIARTPLGPMLDLADGWIRRRHPEWAHLPPASLRMRIGVGNRILRNHESFIEAGSGLVRELGEKSYLRPDSRVLELGCGCGRNAIAIARHLDRVGAYIGQDVDREMIDWCDVHLGGDRCRFHHADIYSAVYNPRGRPVDGYRFPADDGSVSLIVSVSVFSHLLSRDFRHYLTEGYRVLEPGGHLHMTLFVLDFMKQWLGDRWTFAHPMEDCWVENQRYPEAAVAYRFETVEKMLASAGFSVAEIYNRDLYQQTVIATRS